MLYNRANVFVEIETEKLHSTTLTKHHESPKPEQSSYGFSQASRYYGIMMTDLISILECNKDSVKSMRACFDHMVQHADEKIYLDLIESSEYEKTNSVQSFFKLLRPYLKLHDCSLLKTLVQATKCEKAMKRLTKYLHITKNVKLKLGQDFSASPALERPSLEDPFIPESKAANSATLPQPVVRSEPTVDHSPVPVTTTVAADEMSWGMLREIKKLVCGIFRVPQFSMQFDCAEPTGSVTIKWATSKKISSQMQSIVLDDGDKKLFLRENIASMQVGMEYTVNMEG